MEGFAAVSRNSSSHVEYAFILPSLPHCTIYDRLAPCVGFWIEWHEGHLSFESRLHLSPPCICAVRVIIILPFASVPHRTCSVGAFSFQSSFFSNVPLLLNHRGGRPHPNIVVASSYGSRFNRISFLRFWTWFHLSRRHAKGRTADAPRYGRNSEIVITKTGS